jgi:hypothetical protein
MTKPPVHIELMNEAVVRDGEAHRALLAGDADGAAAAFRAASGLYRSSWDAAPPRSYGRLVGMLKAAILAGEATSEAELTRAALGGDVESATAAYALAVADLVCGDDHGARVAAGRMRGSSDALERTAEALDALATGDAERYARALEAIVRDFETRPAHLTGVPIADTAMMLQRLAAPRGLAAPLQSELLPT